MLTLKQAPPVRAGAGGRCLNCRIFSIFGGLFASLLLALLFPASDLSSGGDTEARLPASLLAARLPLCHESQAQRAGCEAAFRYLNELPPNPSSETGSDFLEAPELVFEQLKIQLRNSEIPEHEWVTGALNAWLASLDPHAKLVSKDEADRSANAEKILVQGAGAKLRFHRGKVYVGYTMEGSAAESIGLLPGDQILSINGKSLDPLSDTAKRRWLMEIRSPYKLRIKRDGREKFLVIEEKRYYLANVEAHVESTGRGRREGVIRVRSFDKENTCSELRQAIRLLERAKVQRLRLDLKDNPGGLVREAQCAAGLFLGLGKVFARLERVDDREVSNLVPASHASDSFDERAESVLLTGKQQTTKLPLQVEINQNSASASEMLAAALQDHNRAKLLGTRSFGKGTMQSVFHPWGDENLYLTRTTHLIFRPSGATLQFFGVTPDQELVRLEGENFPRERELTL